MNEGVARAVRERRLTRRELLRAGGGALIGLAGLAIGGCGDDDDDSSAAEDNGSAGGEAEQSRLFDAGVAAGGVSPESAVLWVHTNEEREIRGELALDEGFESKVSEATFTTSENLALNVHWRVQGLTPQTPYFYRFLDGSKSSPAGRFRTGPTDDQASSFHFILSGDSDGTRIDGEPAYNQFEVLSAAAREEADFFLYVGDVIYADSGPGTPAESLSDYHAKYQENRGYSALREVLAAMPVVPVFDDHEVQSDWAGTTIETERYVAGLRAFSDYFPLPFAQPDWDSVEGPENGPRFYRSFRWGSAAEFFLLDTRSYRDPKAEGDCGLAELGFDRLPLLGIDGGTDTARDLRVASGHPERTDERCLESINDRGRTMLGEGQKQWLRAALTASTATIKFIVTSSPMQELFLVPYDRWEGYPAERREVLTFLRDQKISNVIFLTTDQHGNFIGDVYAEFEAERAPVAVEVSTGPIATNTFREKLVDHLGEEQVDDFVELVAANGTRGLEIDVYSYALIKVDAAHGAVTVAIKDEDGETIYEEPLAGTA